MTWLQQNIVVELSASEVAAWCEGPLLLTVVHLSGVAPSRGTELGSLSIRNTHSRKRGFFFVGEEVLVIPTFSKRRGILRGHIDFTSRHLEKESSFFSKAYFLLLHPIIVGQSQMEDVPAGREGEAVLRKQSLVTDNVCLGSIAPEDVAGRIGEVFAKYKIPFTFSQYSHGQRGYAKMRGLKSYMRRVYRLEKGEEDWEDEDGVIRASFSQAEHSLRTAIKNYAQSARPGDVSIEAEEDLVELFRRASIQCQEDIWLRKKAVVEVADGIFETPESRGAGRKVIKLFPNMMTFRVIFDPYWSSSGHNRPSTPSNPGDKGKGVGEEPLVHPGARIILYARGVISVHKNIGSSQEGHGNQRGYLDIIRL